MRFQYDKASKWLIEHHADAILRLAGVTGVESWKALPGEVVQSRQLPDGLVEARLVGRPEPVLFLLEINTYPDNRVPGALLDDLLLTYLDRRQVPEVVTLILAPKGNVRVEPTLALASPFGWSGLTARWRVVNLWELPARDFLPLTDPGLAPWVPLTMVDGPPEPLLQQCRDAIDRVTEVSEKDVLLAVTQVLAGLRYDVRLLKVLFGRDGKMIESPVLDEWFAEREIRIRRTIILEILEGRFGPVPADLSAAVRTIDQEPGLKEATRLAYTCPSFDAFRAALNQPSN